MVSYDFLFENKLLLVKITGEIDKNTMLSFLSFLFEKKEMASVSQVIMDFRETIFQFSLKDLDEIIKLRLASFEILNHVQTVHLVKTSFETAYIMLFAQQIPQELARIEVCSTLKRAIQYLALDLTEEALEASLGKLALNYR